MPWNKSEKTEGAVLKEYAIANGIPYEKIFVTKVSENTTEEAVAVKELIKPCKIIILVTSAFHMYRAKRLFQKQGFVVVLYKVDFKTSRKSIIKVTDYLPKTKNLELTEIAIRKLFGRIYYLLT